MRPFGLVNLGNTCYINTSLQCILRSPSFRSFCVNSGNELGKESLVHRLRQLCAENVKGEGKLVLKPLGLVNILESKLGSMMVIRRQNDMHEFLSLMIQKLVEEVGVKLPKGFKIEEEDAGGQSRVYLALKRFCDDAWVQSHRHEWSALVDILYGQTVSQIVCSHCQKIHHNFAPFLMLDVPVKPNLEESIKEYMSPEPTEVDGWRCDGCKKTSASERAMKIWRLPRTLFISFKRFDARMNKIQGDVAIPQTMPWLSDYVLGPDRIREYELIAVGHHYGSIMGGHYAASVRGEESTWYFVDDDHVRKVNSQTPRFDNAYLLVYHSLE